MKATRRRIAVHGCYNTPNFGDRLLHDIVVARLSAGGDEVCSLSEVRSLRRPSLPYLASCLRFLNVDAAVFGGGGYFNTRRGQSSARNLWRYVVPAKAWFRRHIPFGVIGVGVGPELTPNGAKRVKWICDRARVVSVRDEESRSVLEDIGVDVARVSVNPDWVLTLTADDIPADAAVKAERLLAPYARRRLFGMHFQHAAANPEMAEALVENLGKAMNRLDDVQPLWFFDSSDEVAPMLAALSEKYLPQAKIIPLQDHWTTCALIASMDGIWTTKLHVAIAGAAFERPVFGYSAHGKTRRFFKQLGRQECHAEFGTDPEVLQQWIATWDASGESSAADRGTLNELRGAAHRNFELLDGFLAEVGNR
jgi:polysaccharide pyruvyl transferase WcaK-like protein